MFCGLCKTAGPGLNFKMWRLWEIMQLGQLGYTAVFFLLTYFLALNPSKIVDRVGKILTPLLLLFLAVLFIRSFWAPMAELTAVGIYINYWLPDFPQWLSALICLVVITLINLINVSAYGEFEFWMAIIKVSAIVCMETYIQSTNIKG